MNLLLGHHAIFVAYPVTSSIPHADPQANIYGPVANQGPLPSATRTASDGLPWAGVGFHGSNLRRGPASMGGSSNGSFVAPPYYGSSASGQWHHQHQNSLPVPGSFILAGPPSWGYTGYYLMTRLTDLPSQNHQDVGTGQSSSSGGDRNHLTQSAQVNDYRPRRRHFRRTSERSSSQRSSHRGSEDSSAGGPPTHRFL